MSSLVIATWRNKDRLAAKLKQLAPEAQAGLAKVNLQSADEMVALAEGFVRVRTGLLKSTIRAEPVGGETDGVRVVAGGPATTKPVKDGGYNYDYAMGEEFSNSHNQGQPFFFPSFRLTRKRHRPRASRALNKSIKKVAGK